MILDSSCLYGSCTRLGIIAISLSEGIRKENGGLDKNLILILLEDRKSNIGSGPTLFED